MYYTLSFSFKFVFFFFFLVRGGGKASVGVFWRSFGRKQDFGSIWSIVGNPIWKLPCTRTSRGTKEGGSRWLPPLVWSNEGNRTVASGR